MHTLSKAGLRAIAFAVISLAILAFIGSKFIFAKENAPNTDKQTTQAWYNVIVTGNPNQLDGLEVIGEPIEAPDAEGDCALDNEGNPCAVLLDVPHEDYEFTASTRLSTLPNIDGAAIPSGGADFAREME